MIDNLLNAADKSFGSLLPVVLWLTVLIVVLYYTGVFKWWQNNYEECARDNATGKFSITNQLRIWFGIAFIIRWFANGFDIVTVPAFKLVPQKMDLSEMALIFGFLSGSYAVQQYLKKKEFNNPEPATVNVNDTAQATVITPGTGPVTEPGKINCPKAAAEAAARAAGAPFVVDKSKADPGVINE